MHGNPKCSMDIYALVKTLFKPGQLKNQKLVTLAEHFQVTDQIEAFHNAESDTLATILVANQMSGFMQTGRSDRKRGNLQGQKRPLLRASEKLESQADLCRYRYHEILL